MFVSMNWIRDYVNLDGLDIENLIHRFTLATAEVEDIIYKGKELKDVVVGQIISIENHPDSKKLHLLKVDGGDRIYDVVCGAPNAALNIKIPFVKAGGCVPGMEIKKCKVAGFESEGMCCSEHELGISDDHSGLMILDDSLVVGTDIKDVFPIDDIIFEVDNKSLTNRPDLWGHYGIAREFSALTGRELKPLTLGDLSCDKDYAVPVTVVREDLVYRYSCIRMDNINRTTSPDYIRIRLFYCGMRSINLLADITNYVMLEIGQPTHAFDANNIDHIRIDTPAQDMKFTTLDETEREIDTNTLMIYNNDTPVAVAGIMGGLDSEIVDNSNSVVLESANFDGICVRKSSSRLGLRTDASARYEKMLDPELTLTAVGRFVSLVKECDENAVVSSQLTDVYVKKYDTITISFDKAYVDRYTGIDISNERIFDTLVSLGFGVKREGDEFTVTVPSWRATKDVTLKADIIEEITRIYGYDNFEITTTSSNLFPVRKAASKTEDNAIKDILVKKFAAHEVHSYIWCDGIKYKKLGIEIEDNVRILNIASPENSVIRNSMLPTMLSFAYENKSFADNFTLFEIGRVVACTKEDGTCNEVRRLGLVSFDKSAGEKAVYFKCVAMVRKLFDDLKHLPVTFEKTTPAHNWQHPRNTSNVYCNGVLCGVICTLHPTNAAKLDKKGYAVCVELDMDAFNSIAPAAVNFDAPSAFPGIDYDLSLVLTETKRFSEIATAWEKLNIAELKNVSLVDTYETEGLKSITVRLSFSSSEHTLAMDEIQTNIDTILNNLKEMGITLRA
ncbi:MAG: phenylalanine--tRNA ligase subunit beta [Clostridia bacterium]|nr:phenylalanine--tRNA ligase subunit beta [Clostridia bacterium]